MRRRCTTCTFMAGNAECRKLDCPFFPTGAGPRKMLLDTSAMPREDAIRLRGEREDEAI